jgi:tetratricopeptide (TPR) repeat protein
MLRTVKQHEDEQAKNTPEELVDIPTTKDLLNFTTYAESIAESIGRDFNKTMPRTIGVYGDWGSGKTSFMKMIEQRLRKKEIYPIWFNAWKYDKEDNLWAALIQTIFDQARVSGGKHRRPLVKLRIWMTNIRLGNGLWEVIKKLSPLLFRLLIISICFIVLGLDSKVTATFLSTWLLNTPVPSMAVQAFVKTFIVFVALIAVDPFKLINLFNGKLGIDYSKFSHQPSYRGHIAFLDEFREEFERIVRLLGRGNPLVVIIDDLDRCLPEKTIQVIEAIKNFLDIEGCVFLLGFDSKMVENAVAIKYKEIITFNNDNKNGVIQKNTIYHKDYMDKIIQQPILLPRLPKAEIETFVKRLSDDEDIHLCAGIFGTGLSPNPRKIKRILRNFLFVRDVVANDIKKGEVKLGVLAKFIVIQNQLPEVYEMLDEQPSLLKELETYYLDLSDPNLAAKEVNSSVSEQADKLGLQYPELRKILLIKGFDENDSFNKVDIYHYITLIGALAELRPTPIEKPPSISGDVLSQIKIESQLRNPPNTASLSSLPTSSVPLVIWNMPYRRNPFFTGRESLIHHLHDRLTSENAITITQPLAINGLGGIGKTQLAVEYAYRYRDTYKAILWVKADTSNSIIEDFIVLAGLLDLPDMNAQDQSIIVAAVKRWLETNIGWLLIFDNAEDLTMVRDFIPWTSKGHTLLTTRAHALGEFAQVIELESMELEEGALFLLRRSKTIASTAPLNVASPADYERAKQIVVAMDCLPLALDQAGAYIEETGCTLSKYLEFYQQRQTTLLQRRGMSRNDHPESVTTTWSLSFEKVEKASTTAVDLLRLCAFLSPYAIPEELIIEGASELTPTLQFAAADISRLNEAIAELLKYSLIRRNATTLTLDIHRLVQAVVKDEMDERMQRQWAELTVRAVNRAFPEAKFTNWHICERYLPHAQVCALLIEQWNMAFPEAARLLNEVGWFLLKRGWYEQALPFYQHALAIREKALGPDHPDTATSLDNLAQLYRAQGKYEQALPLLQRALAIREQQLGPDHPDTATSLDNLAVLYRSQGDYEQAKLLFEHALAIREQVLGPNHPDTATSLNNLAGLYDSQGDYEQAKLLFERALAILEKTFDPNYPNTKIVQENLARLIEDIKKKKKK